MRSAYAASRYGDTREDRDASPDRLRTLLSELGNVEVSADGVRILYPPDILLHLASTTIPVPKGGKGLR